MKGEEGEGEGENSEEWIRERGWREGRRGEWGRGNGRLREKGKGRTGKGKEKSK